MKQETLYQDWLESRRDANLSAGFTDDLMHEVHRLDSQRRRSRSLWSRTMDWIRFSTWVRAAAVTAAALLGLARIAMTLRLLLFA